MADTVVTVQDRAEAAVIAATSECRQALAKIGDNVTTCRVPQWTWKVSEVATSPNVTRAIIWRYQYHQPGALAEDGGQALEDAVVPDIVETFPNVQIRQFAVPFYCHVSLKKVRGLITNDAYHFKAGVLVILYL